MTDELRVLQDVSTKLDAAGIGYMLTGSMAMQYYAQPRMTRDLDLVVALQENDVDTIVALFEVDYYVHREDVRESIRRRSMFNLIHNETIVKVDCIVRKDEPYRREEFGRRRRIAANGFETWIASKEDLILSKLSWARDSFSEMQFRDIRNLMQTGFDQAYVERWVADLDLTAVFDACRHA